MRIVCVIVVASIAIAAVAAQEQGAREAMRRTRAGELRPFTLQKPYRVEFSLRRSYADSLVTRIDEVVAEWGGEKTGARSYRYSTSDARRLAWMIDRIEGVVLP